jgi:1-acyl-sn-glycerol-3-phosphate acyltransferase
MAKEEIFRSIAARAFFRLWGGTFAVRRGQNDVRAVRDALALIRAGAALVVFPEGTRRTTGLGEAQPGIGYLASRLGCPVVPVAIVGTERIGGLGSLRDHPAFTVTVGEPLHVSDRSMSAAEVAARIMSHVAALLPPARRGAYAVTSEPAVTA